MRSAHITRRQAEAAFDGLDADVSALQEGVARAFDVDGGYGIDDVGEPVELVLTAREQIEMHRLLHDDTDQAPGWHSSRRAGRLVVRPLLAGAATAADGNEVAA
jgi:hypothetical protein